MTHCVILPLFLTCILLADASHDNDVNTTSGGQPLLIKFPVPIASSVTDYLHIQMTKSTTSSLSLSWEFPDYQPNGTLEAVFVGYEQGYGKFISDKLDGVITEFELHHLKADTDYNICVEVIENISNTIVSHANCVPLSTIKLIRTDSILLLLLAVGYIIVMILIGCILWRRKVSQISGIHPMSTPQHYGHDTKVMRWQDIEEQIVLKPREADGAVPEN